MLLKILAGTKSSGDFGIGYRAATSGKDFLFGALRYAPALNNPG